MNFSERMGITSPRLEIQKDDIGQPLRNGMWDIYVKFFFELGYSEVAHGYRTRVSRQPFVDKYLYALWHEHFKWPFDSCPIDNRDQLYSDLRKIFLDYKWNELYDFIEFTLVHYNSDLFIAEINKILERELSAYRFVGDSFAPITDDHAVKSIENALGAVSKFKGVETHIKTAIAFLSDRKAPDYRNSIKESISAVEGICQIVSQDPKAELGKALKAIESKQLIHGALKSAFGSLYGYTSDSTGIRHALLDEPNLYQEDAIYFLITCSAFITYLLQKCSRVGLKI